MKRWLVLRSFAIVGEKLIGDGCYTELDGVDIHVLKYRDGSIVFSNKDTGEMLYVHYKDGIDYISDWGMITCTNIATA